MSYAQSGGNWASITLGQQGLLTDMPSSEIPPTALIRSTNIDYGPGFLQKAPGAIRYNASALTAGVVGIQDYWVDINRQRLLAATSDGKLWKDFGDRTFNGTAPIVTGLGNLTNACSFVIAGNESAGNQKKVFFFTGGISQVQVIPGDTNTAAAIALPAADWPNPTASSNPQSNFPRFGLNHRGRLWVFAKSVAYASSTTNHEDFQTPSAYLVNNVGPGEGGDIIGGFIYKGTMLVFKQGDLIYQLVDTDVSSANWYFKRFGEGLGIAGVHGACQVLDDLILGNAAGSLTSLKATLNYGNFTQGDLLKEMRIAQYYRQRTTPAGIPFMHSLYYPDKGRASFTARSAYNTYNDTLIQLDVSNPQQPRYGLWNHYQADCLALRRDINNVTRPIYGTKDGYVYLADRETRAVNGAAYLAEFRTPYLDFRHLDPSLSVKQKAYEYVAVTFTPDGNHSLSIDVWIDGRLSQTVTAAMTLDTNYLGSFKLGSSILGSEDEQTIPVPISGTGRRISLRCYNANALESFKVSQLAIGFRVLAEENSRIS